MQSATLFRACTSAQEPSDNTIGGTTAGSGNVISGNGNDGIWLNGASDNVVDGNMIGTDSTGTQELGNTYSGVYIDARAPNNTIGGTTAGVGRPDLGEWQLWCRHQRPGHQPKHR